MRVVITGSSGQIGTNLGLKLMGRGDEVVGLDVRANTWTDAIPTFPVNLLENGALRGALKDVGRPDVIVHLAAHAKVFELVQNPAKAFENVKMFFPVMEYARELDVPLVFASSREVYGEIRRWVTAENDVDMVSAQSPYSASKIAGEAFLSSYQQCYGLRYLVFRFSNVYGRYDCDLERLERVIPLFIRYVQREEPITVFGKDKILDFTYVDDCVDGVVKGIDALARGAVKAETINLAFGHGYSLEDVVNMISLGLGRHPNVEFLGSRRGEVTHYVADISKARELLGYAPSTRLCVGIQKAIEWQRSIGAV